MVTQTINLSMIPGSVPPIIHVNQYDSDTGALVFKLFSGGEYSVPAGSAVVINGTKPDGYGFSYSASYSENTVTADITQQMTAVAGDVGCELRITNGGNVVGTQNFVLLVEPAALSDDTVISDSDIPAIAAAADEAASAASSATAAAGSATAAAASATQADADLAQIFGIGTKVGNTDNLNSYKTPGKYYADAGHSITNSPVASSGFAMLIYPAYNVARFVQVVFGLDGSISVRAMYRTQSSTDYWSEWWKSSDAKSLVCRKVIASPTDFNTITEVGDYSFPPEVASASGSNCPFSVGGRLTVEYSAGLDLPQFKRQTASKYAGADTYTRTTDNGGSIWTNWYKFTTTDTGA